MVETLTFSRIGLEDLFIDEDVRQVRLQDNVLHDISGVHLGNLFLLQTRTQTATAGAAQLTVTFSNPAGAIVFGITVKNAVALGTTNGLTGYSVGDSVVENRWRTSHPVTLNAESDSQHFQPGTPPIVGANYQVLLTGEGGTFDGTGQIETTCHYFRIRHRTA